ncbi:MAG TPA: hypothetical protein VFU37_04085 [Pyrinomonadaceae bacterium]|nr:hypothetical protein [Pyrinomonadaceae bacterium]
MAEKILLFLLCLGLSIYFWFLVFQPSTRQKSNKPIYHFWRMDKQMRADADAMQLAALIIAALICSLATLIFIFVAIYRVA